MTGRISAKGKFFFDANGSKFFLKGVTYGTFRSDEDGYQFPSREVVIKDFCLMNELGANCLRIYTKPPHWFLELAHEHHLKILLGIAWSQHINFLDSPAIQSQIRATIASVTRAHAGHPSIFGYMIGNEIPSDIVRWHGHKKIEGFLRDLYKVAKDNDSEALVSYANYPTTEYLDLDFLDYISFNVYLHRDEDYRSYLMRLQNIAETKPLVLSEFGVDSLREGEAEQARVLDNKLTASYELGCAGTIIFSWTDEWFTGGSDITDWAFGLVTREREIKLSFGAVQKHYHGVLPPPLSHYPKVSVVVCAYNADRTIDSCLASLEHLNYPNYEVIVVNDGSTDRTKEICHQYGYIRLINQVNCGLSVARNVGLYSANGEIVAYTDADCDADPDWLNYLVITFQLTGKQAVGGPNFPPPEDAFIPACVAVSPGGPTHVLLDDSTAEHIAGCNMAFRRDLLKSIGGFDPQFRAAGDDVDICWRLQDEGYDISFSPAAVVWHFRRNTVADYLKQQRGYGKAEALVYFKHPDRFNLLGQARWLGRIYGDIASTIFVSKPVIYSGVFGRGLFQTLYASPAPVWSYLPVTLEWNLFSFLFLGVILALGVNPLWALGPFLITWASCIAGSLQARIDPRFSGPKARILVALLIYLGPFLRGYERYKWRMSGLSKPQQLLGSMKVSPLKLCFPKHSIRLAFWSESGVERDELLTHLIDFLSPRKYFVKVDGGWSRWDLKVYQGLWARATILSASENHGGTRRLIRFSLRSIPSSLERILGFAVIAIAALFLWLQLIYVAMSVLIIGLVAYLMICAQKNLLLLRLSSIITQIAHDQKLLDVSRRSVDIQSSVTQAS